jgi:murein DD-endopeptidase MepM/ murein hydrolase activator NlpD
MIFRSPVTRPLHGPAWTRPPKNTDFRVTLTFGCSKVQAEPALGNCKHFHRAIDISDGRSGSRVVAAVAGKVRFADMLNIGGLAVLIDHGDGWWSEYAHLKDATVAHGDPVTKGARIGHVGSSGADLAHLHFGVKRHVKIGAAAKPSSVAGQYYNEDNDRDHWQDPWPLLEQNVRIHPRVDVEDIRIRTEPALGSTTLFATTTAAGRLRRASDGADLGPAGEWRDWGGQVKGASYPVDGGEDDAWDRIELDGAFRFIASRFAVRSAR